MKDRAEYCFKKGNTQMISIQLHRPVSIAYSNDTLLMNGVEKERHNTLILSWFMMHHRNTPTGVLRSRILSSTHVKLGRKRMVEMQRDFYILECDSKILYLAEKYTNSLSELLSVAVELYYNHYYKEEVKAEYERLQKIYEKSI